MDNKIIQGCENSERDSRNLGQSSIKITLSGTEVDAAAAAASVVS